MNYNIEILLKGTSHDEKIYETDVKLCFINTAAGVNENCLSADIPLI